MRVYTCPAGAVQQVWRELDAEVSRLTAQCNSAHAAYGYTPPELADKQWAALQQLIDYERAVETRNAK